MTQPKNPHSGQVVKNSRGQISIFFGVTLVTIFSFIAFIVNVGLFVKAKINLQNAVDSAAWSGAASQARQLTNIAHLNWEMRNTYKEWMFKYYVLGQLANENIHNTTGANMNFALKRFDSGGSGFSSGIQGDHYNVPSICLHFGSGNENICTIYQVPGLPRFHVAGIPDVSEEFEATMDAFVKLKANNCAVRSTYNFQAARNYAYSSGVTTETDIPIAAANRTGAWIEAMELSLRMRNLEMMVNLPPITQGICGRNGPAGCVTPDQLANENATHQIPINDRPLKAYLAGLKTIGGGEFKNDKGNAFANTFVLYELEPKSYSPSLQSLSSFLIPQGATYPNGEPVISSKKYLDLIPMVMNFTTFFTTFAPTTEALTTVGVSDSSGTAAEASCASTKTALPVPGYILGFYKNPSVVTYYAVKGKAQYQGLLNPFFSPFELSAYAAAKPFGGRIGPALTAPLDGANYTESSANRARKGLDGSSRTANYVMGFQNTDTNGSPDPRISDDVNDGKKIQGLPLPSNADFFLGASDTELAIGGTPEASSSIKFSIPNLIYNLDSIPSVGDNLPTLIYNSNISSIDSMNPVPGLFDTKQFDSFIRNIPSYSPGAAGVPADKLIEAFANVRAPTNYDALNYMVPTLLDAEAGSAGDHYPTVRYLNPDTKTIGYFAPLFHPALLFNDQEVVKDVLRDYIESLSNSVISYREALKLYATKVANTSAQDSSSYIEASKAIYNEAEDGDTSNLTVSPIAQCQKQSIASRFTYFLMETSETEAKEDYCRIIPLLGSVIENVTSKATDTTTRLFYIATYRQGNEANTSAGVVDNNQLRSAYSPGKDYGGSEDGISTNPLTGRSKNHRRNGYSTKLISLKSITDNAVGYANNISNYMESQSSLSPESTTPITPLDIKSTSDIIYNILPASELSEFGTDLYF